MEFRLLGPLEVVDGTESLALGGRKARALLGRLVLDVNRTVSVQRLVDDLWGEGAPESASKMVQIHVSTLRKVLPTGVLVTRPPGYVVEADPESVDVTRFIRLRGEGRAALAAGDPDSAAARLRDALHLWRGPALAEFSEPFARVEGAHLEELRIVCLEERIDADLALGRHADVVGELEALVARHPLREALHGQLMLALYRAGRQAEALDTYAVFRRVLDEQLGIEPSGALKSLQSRILQQASDLDLRTESQSPAAVMAPPAGERRSVGASSGFVGRVDELRRLDRALDAADREQGGIVLIAGRAGIGKTRLTATVTDLACDRGAIVLSGRCIQLVGTGLPYLPLVDALRPVRGSDALQELAGELRELPRLIPDLAGAGTGSAPDQPRDDSRLRLFEEVLAVLGRLSRERLLVLVIEDLHWADSSTLDLVSFLANAVRDRRILLVATYRSEEVRTGGHLHRLAAGLVGGGVAMSVQLEPLDSAELEALLVSLSVEPPSRELVSAITIRSEGNPFFARELLAAATRGDTALPPALRDVLLVTVSRLDANSRAVLRVAAAAGRDVQYGLLAALLPLPELELAEALRQAVEHDVLSSDQAAGTFRFRHELYAEAVYATLLPGEREVLHERLARAITAEPRLAASGATAAEAAQHWTAAGRPFEALEASLQAAREAEAVSGLTEALHYVERVLELWDEVPVAEELAGVALPAVLEWAAELAGMSAQSDDVDVRRVIGVLGPGQSLDLDEVADRLGVGQEAAARTLAALESDGLVERVGERTFRCAPLAVVEARRLYPSVVVLESLAVRVSPPFPSATLDAMKAANARFRAAKRDPAAAITADDDFHRHLTAGCGNEHLLAALRPVRRALLRYEQVYMRDPGRVERSAVQHDAIIEALERGDLGEASQRVRENLAGGLPDLTDALEH